MTTVILGPEDVRRLLPYPDCIDAVAGALERLARGGARQPVRTNMGIPDRAALLASMPGYLDSPETLGTKVLTVFPENHAQQRPSHQGVVVLFDPVHGEPIAVLDASTLTEIRTASVSAAATRALSRPGATELAVLGTGAQADAHARAIPCVRRVRHIRVWGRRPEQARAFAARLARTQVLPVEVFETAEEAVRSADLVCTTTSSSRPVLEGEWLAPGTHVNAVGAVGPGLRELDARTLQRARVYVDHRESAMAESEDLKVPLADGTLRPDDVLGEVGQVLLGTLPGRRSEEEITVFKSVGLAIEDLAAARLVHERAVAQGTGTRVEITGGRS
jgi:ornithine cyclodeaminase/alanine dehydrogenase-like protein (mu-crystallin family)